MAADRFNGDTVLFDAVHMPLFSLPELKVDLLLTRLCDSCG